MYCVHGHRHDFQSGGGGATWLSTSQLPDGLKYLFVMPRGSYSLRTSGHDADHIEWQLGSLIYCHFNIIAMCMCMKVYACMSVYMCVWYMAATCVCVCACVYVLHLPSTARKCSTTIVKYTKIEILQQQNCWFLMNDCKALDKLFYR